MKNIEIATLGGGCFWCLETLYRDLKGVEKVLSGYAGGKKGTASYRLVCSGTTQHVEVVQVHFDANVISYLDILEIFWTMHDPTTLNRQGNDRGPQYRSVIFHHSSAQEKAAHQSLITVGSEIWDQPIVTEITPFTTFFEAEEDHQNYYNKTGGQNPYCQAIISPKIVKFRKKYATLLK